MKKKIIIIAVLLVVALGFGMAVSFADESDGEIKNNSYIVDLNLDSDLDELCALDIVCNLASSNKIRLKGICINTNEQEAVDALSGFLDYKDLNIRIGYGQKSGVVESYWKDLIKYKENERTAMSSTELYKKVLTESNDKIYIMAIGHLNNLTDLLKDEEGRALVAKKCNAVYIQGGSFPDGWDKKFGYDEEAISNIKYVVGNCPVPIYFLAHNAESKIDVDDIKTKLVAEVVKKYSVKQNLKQIKSTAVLTILQKENEELVVIPVDFTIDEFGINTFTENKLSKNFVVYEK